MAIEAATNGVHETSKNGAENGTKSAYQYSSHYMWKPRPIRIIVVGCGVSGIAAVKIFKERFPGKPVELVIYEKNAGVAGTWFENRYPGCSCDVPSHAYSFSWEGNPYWSRAYVDWKELLEYFTGRAKAYGVYDFVHLEHRVSKAVWNDFTGQWEVEIDNLKTGEKIVDKGEVLVNATGFLNNWKWPDIPGLQSFKGVLAHSAHYDTSLKLDDRVVGVIGSGSSAIQIVPQAQRVAKHLYSFHRSPTWITPELVAELAPQGRETVFTREQQEAWANDPDGFLRHRKRAESTMNHFFDIQVKNSSLQKQAAEETRRQMIDQLSKKKELIPKLVPEFALGCRRITPGHGYLEALCSDNVTVQTEEIREVVPDGLILDDGTHIKLDVLICATGFNTSFCPPFTLVGEGGQVINEIWKDEPRSYLGFGAAGFPNYFITSGPNSPTANGALIPCFEFCLRFAYNAAEKLMTENIKSITPKQEAVDDFQEHKDSVMKDLVWTSSCRSWYKNGTIDGTVWGPWPGSAVHFLELITTPRWEDFNFKYRSSNRFEFLGRGRTARELEGGDLAWYLDQPGASDAARKEIVHVNDPIMASDPEESIVAGEE
ncbi:hypothetical protein Z517_00187 [Fonsecaea pedrosoi CBS 271.37]|uniref:FAD/NAD(P)-binding domain-containing protein n=1 Tax=Fonsecaea pedrosoi CBS 271.37 TaxID=1442368 RepID=A0A0D2HJW2_9EURO|nr:uncharacterized protein Z517_00187 [Fonsecaea pedrosoi CBS 271.37]KIW84799.1 hypothetical protein Z517_00187 [Fonsecaea pedrosoi CBS 271.37]